VSFLSNLWDDVQSVAKPFVASIPVVGGFAASRIQMSPTPQQASVSSSLTPTANAVGYDVQQALAASRGQTSGVSGLLGGGGMILLGGFLFVIALYFLLNRRE